MNTPHMGKSVSVLTHRYAVSLSVLQRMQLLLMLMQLMMMMMTMMIIIL